MGAMQAIMSGVMTMFLFAMVIVTVWKLFQVSGELNEIKTLLTEMRRTTPAAKPVETAAAFRTNLARIRRSPPARSSSRITSDGRRAPQNNRLADRQGRTCSLC